MAPLTIDSLKGNWGTLLLPVNDDDSFDYSRLGDEIDLLIAAGVDGIYSNGTAGELHNQAEEEFDRINSLLAEKCQCAGMAFQIGVSHPSPWLSLERIRRSLHLAPGAFQVILPDWVIPTEEEQTAFLQRMARTAGDVPLVLYNPPHAKLVLEPPAYGKLKIAVPELIGLKVGMGKAGMGEAEWVAAMKEHTGSLAVFVPGHLLATGVRQKLAAGAYSNVACISPRGAQVWWRLIQSDPAEGILVQQMILDFFDRCITPYKMAGYSNPALDKFLAAVGGWSSVGTRLRWPYKWIAASEVGHVRKEAERLLPGFLLT